ncbi:MAG: flagellar biosynthesis protein FlhB [Pseudomonadota bacterium]
MAEQTDQAQRTEEPTPKRLEDARKKGDAPKSQEVTAAVMLAAGALGLWLLGAPAAESVAALGAPFIGRPHDFIVDAGAMQALFASVAFKAGAAFAAFGVLIVIAAILGNVTQARPVFTTERMKPQLSKISPLAGAKRIFGPTGLVNFLKGVGKLLIVGAILIFALWPDRMLLTGLVYAPERDLLQTISVTILKLTGLTVAAMLVIAALDVGYQRHAWRKRLRMTKEEVRREQKETEGDPQIRARLRSQREAVSRRRMMVAVEDATVLIMNPTHYAVALKYEAGDDGAPICVAKGVDDLALRMRDVANDNNVPVIENPPLARALHAAAELDQEIPIDHYEAVAKVIGFIMSRSKASD